eukprot:CAMPEP_0174360960 /NCGR_PEP_ID=MMETSP0811_2-20130205/57038_1 /TAXON_ID=73025 ORGANISM="Eutreptiella gymnastica-like, Strain CCMP1594" /NCGR_SAMPLE_ID=MMETSP0811_2 /ASSEMBLY_ACC=CAM_ASM_000667 /LENGTH=31 /DNA_ID= /DNA_START= /DNA_END= /DNA_ORIENTATION=
MQRVWGCRPPGSRWGGGAVAERTGGPGQGQG